MVSQVYTYVKTYQVVLFKYVKFIMCQLYLNKAVKNIRSQNINHLNPTTHLTYAFHPTIFKYVTTYKYLITM